ncbi:hypothetical protein BC940DRAFT_296304 [Gongronella butleri]|nr:hypothetical protein BC940DRAFT_296304 [Gongronella butleri]
MGCCNSSEATVHEVVFDEQGIAKRVAKGQGTHLIHVYSDMETDIQKKVEPVVLPSEYHKQVVEPKAPQAAYLPAPAPTTGSLKRKGTITRPSSISKRVQPAPWSVAPQPAAPMAA